MFDANSKPCLPKNVVCKKVDTDVRLLIDPGIPNWVSVNKIGLEILECCNGSKTVAQITEELAKIHSLKSESFVSDVLEFLNKVAEKDFLFQGVSGLKAIAPQQPALLREMWIHLTNFCNLKCIHCHLSSGASFERELSRTEISNLIGQFLRLGGEKIVFSGGEPTSRGDLMKILDDARGQLKGRILLITNGTLITTELARRLKELEIVVQVSLDGPNARTNDPIRGKGAYKQAIKGINILIREDVDIAIGMILMKLNVHEVYEMTKMVQRLGLGKLHIGLLQVKGRAKENENTLFLSDSELLRAFHDIRQARIRTGVHIDWAEGVNLSIATRGRRDFCGAGKSLMSVAANGDVYPCAGLHLQDFYVGNIRTEGLKSMWENSSVLKMLRDLFLAKIPECDICEFKYMCGGGCHIDRLFHSGRLLTRHPRCGIFKTIFWDSLCEIAKKPMADNSAARIEAQKQRFQ